MIKERERREIRFEVSLSPSLSFYFIFKRKRGLTKRREKRRRELTKVREITQVREKERER